MMNSISAISSASYQYGLKPLLFQLDSEFVHENMVNLGQWCGQNSWAKKIFSSCYSYQHPALSQSLGGISFPNPVGLAAGFDYDAKLTQILPSLGFGFATVGSITACPYGGNPRPRLGRLPKSKSLMVNKGLKSIGTPKIIAKLAPLKFQIPLGISVARTNSKDTAEEKKGIADYIESFVQLEKAQMATHYELNISCPNAYGGEPFTVPKKLTRLLQAIKQLHLKTPLLIKMPTDLGISEALELMLVVKKYPVAGLIFGNLTKDRQNRLIHPSERDKYAAGNFSGKPTWVRSNTLLAAIYKKYKKQFILIGCGGVFSAQDAYTKIKLGASLVELITGMIYQGPQLIGQINAGLVKLLHEDGYDSISQAIGKGI